MKTTPWHSNEQKPEYHHDNTRCKHGNEIPKDKKVSGTGNKPICPECEKHNKEGK